LIVFSIFVTSLIECPQLNTAKHGAAMIGVSERSPKTVLEDNRAQL